MHWLRRSLSPRLPMLGAKNTLVRELRYEEMVRTTPW